MKSIGIKVYITEGCRLTKKSSENLVRITEEVFRRNGFALSFPIISTTYIEEILDNGVSIFNFNLQHNTNLLDFVKENPHFYSVEKHKELLLFPKDDIIHLVLVKSLHDTDLDSWPSNATFEQTNTIFISESCYEYSLAHSMMNHFGVKDQYHNPSCISYGYEILRQDTLISEDEKLILSEEFSNKILQ